MKFNLIEEKMTIIYRFLLMLFIPISTTCVQANPALEEVLEHYRKTLPTPPKRGDSLNETALRATHFICKFLKEEEGISLRESLKTIDTSSSLDSLAEQSFFYNLYRGQDGALRFKSSLEKRIASLYQLFLRALQRKAPIVGYLYGAAFKSAYLYNFHTGKGKVLARSVDLQERIEYETYRYLREHLRALEIDFQFVVIRDTFHALSLNLGAKDRIYASAPEIIQYGREVQRISRETHICTLNLEDLMYGIIQPIPKEITFDRFIEENSKIVLAKSHDIPKQRSMRLKGFFAKEYDDEDFSRSQKEKRAMERAQRYLGMKDFVREHEKKFLIPTFMRLFGADVHLIPFSMHVEEYLPTCEKVPLRTIMNFCGGCNTKHQLPFLQQKSNGSLIVCSIRNDMMTKLFQKYGKGIRLIDVGPYKTFSYQGDENLIDK